MSRAQKDSYYQILSAKIFQEEDKAKVRRIQAALERRAPFQETKQETPNEMQVSSEANQVNPSKKGNGNPFGLSNTERNMLHMAWVIGREF